MPEKQIPETPPELDPNLTGPEAEGQGFHNEEEPGEHSANETSSSSAPTGPDKLLEELIAEDDETDDNNTSTPKSKRKRLRKRLHVRREKAVKSLSDIFAQSRKKQKNYRNMLKDSYREGKKKAQDYKEAKQHKKKRTRRIINAIKRNHARNNE